MRLVSVKWHSAMHIDLALLLLIVLLTLVMKARQSAEGQTGCNPVAMISAASFTQNAIAQESIISAFGTMLATEVAVAQASPLPTSLLGTTVRVIDSAGVERLAPLFFVSPSQINYYLPSGTREGSATIRITSGDGKCSIGTMQVAKAAPAIFTANSDGIGVPATSALRITYPDPNDPPPLPDPKLTYEPIATYDNEKKRYVPLPISPPANSRERVFLILYLTGVRFADANTVKVLLGSRSITPTFAGALSGFTGLDQINAEIPNDLAGSGNIKLSVSAKDAITSNIVEVEIGSVAGAFPPQVSDPSPAPVSAGEQMIIRGTRFDADKMKNRVRIGGLEAKVLPISSPVDQLTIRIPFGVETGPISVRTPQGEAQSNRPLNIQTSASGFVEDTFSQPLAGVKVRLLPSNLNIETTTNSEGSFVLTSVPEGVQIIEIDGANLPGSLPFPTIKLPLDVGKGRDNTFPARIALQQNTGPSLQVGTGDPALTRNLSRQAIATAAQQPGSGVVRTKDIVFEVEGGTRATFPDNSTIGRLTLTGVENSRTPVALPNGLFSSSIAQIAPLNVRLSPGAKLTFPNPDKIPPGTQAKLFRIDQTVGSQTIGSFIEVGTALVSEDGTRIETARNAVNLTSIYFVAAQRTTTTIIGRVLESDEKTPVRLARVRARGQDRITDGDGGFIIPNVIASEGDDVTVEASFQRADKKVDRTLPKTLKAVVGGITNAGDLALSAEGSNRPPVIQAPATLAMNIRDERREDIVVTDPDSASTPTVAVSGASFATILPNGSSRFILRLTPGEGDAGRYLLTITALDNLGAKRDHKIELKLNRPPVAMSQMIPLDEDSSNTPITLSGSDLDEDDKRLSFIIVTNPGHGSLTGSAPNLTFTPEANYNGEDRFTFKTTDGTGESPVATITLLIRARNDDPVIVLPPLPAKVDTQSSVSFSVRASDIDGDMLTLSATGLPSGATFPPATARGTVSSTFTWTPGSTQFGLTTIAFTVTDGARQVTQTGSLIVTPRWEQSAGKIEAGQVFALLSTNGRLYAGTSGGIFKSDNQGLTWTASSINSTVLHINALAATDTEVFAGTNGGGIYRSTDNGQNWARINDGLLNTDIRAFAVFGTEVYAGTFGSGVYRLASNRQSWTPSVSNPMTFKVNALLADNTGGIYAGTEGSGILRLLNNSWSPVNSGLANLSVRALASLGSQLYVGTDGGGVFRSLDNGQSWQVVDELNLPNRTINALAVSGTILLAGSSGGGIFSLQNDKWSECKAGLDNPFVSSITSVGGYTLAGTAGGGVYRTPNQSCAWTSANSGLATSTVNALAINGAHIFAGTAGNGVSCSIDNGLSWIKANEGLPGIYVNAFLIHGGKLYAAANAGIFTSPLPSPNCATWSDASADMPPNRYVNALASSGSNSNATLYAGTNLGVFRLNNQTQRWEAAHTGITDKDIRAVAVLNNVVFAGTENGGIFKSIDQGQTWAAVNNGLVNQCSNLPGSIRVHAIHTDGSRIFAGTCNGVFRSSDMGQSWQHISSRGVGLPENAFVNTIFEKEGKLFVGLFGGIYMSTNYLATDASQVKWTIANTDLTHINVFSLGATGQILMAGTIGGGVYQSK
ncbi:MAG: Ig-like domain-containing protein [Blastocatellia bacterium]|nr:Ig-like domain-containing protein [Blastocatellia bacterium]